MLEGNVEAVSLDNDLGLGTGPMTEGRHVLDWIEDQVANGSIDRFDIQIHTQNSQARQVMEVVRERVYRRWDN